MLVIAGLISDHVQATHAVQKLRARGIAPAAIRTITRDPAAARAVAAATGSEYGVAIITGALAGALVGGMGGWVLGASANPLAGLLGGVLGGPIGTGLAGAGVGLVLGALLGLLLGWLADRRQAVLYERGVRAGDVLLVVEVPEAQLRETEQLLLSYGAYGLSTGVSRPQPAPRTVPSEQHPETAQGGRD
ncbi:MAG TPA: hypothetical protein VFB73_11350 [Chloroflexota bacterium]|nr:hypothetical protein [Chloroflexota bacterium]